MRDGAELDGRSWSTSPPNGAASSSSRDCSSPWSYRRDPRRATTDHRPHLLVRFASPKKKCVMARQHCRLGRQTDSRPMTATMSSRPRSRRTKHEYRNHEATDAVGAVSGSRTQFSQGQGGIQTWTNLPEGVKLTLLNGAVGTVVANPHDGGYLLVEFSEHPDASQVGEEVYVFFNEVKSAEG